MSDAAGAPQQERALARRIVNAVFARRHALDRAEEWHIHSDRLSPDKAQEATREYEATWAEAENKVLSLLATSLRSTSLPSVGRSEERQKLLAEYDKVRGKYWGNDTDELYATMAAADALASHIRSEP